MPRATHPRPNAKHARAHTRNQRRRWARRRLRRALDSNPAYLTGQWARTVKLEVAALSPWRFRQGVSPALAAQQRELEAALTPLRVQLQRYGQYGPLYYLQPLAVAALPRGLRRNLRIYEGLAPVEALHERGNYEPYDYDSWWAGSTGPYHRSRERRRWQHERETETLAEDGDDSPALRRRQRRRPASQCGARRGRGHDWGTWIIPHYSWAERERIYEQCCCRRCGRICRRRAHDSGVELARRLAERDHWAVENIFLRLYGSG